MDFEQTMRIAASKPKPFKNNEGLNTEFQDCIELVRNQLLKLDLFTKYPQLEKAYRNLMNFLLVKQLPYETVNIFNRLFIHLNLIDRYDEYGVSELDIGKYYKKVLEALKRSLNDLEKRLPKSSEEEYKSLKKEFMIQTTQPLTRLMLRDLNKHAQSMAENLVQHKADLLKKLDKRIQGLSKGSTGTSQSSEKSDATTVKEQKSSSAQTDILLKADQSLVHQITIFKTKLIKDNSEEASEILEENKLNLITEQSCPEIFRYQNIASKPREMATLTSELEEVISTFYNPKKIPRDFEDLNTFYKNVEAQIQSKQNALSIPRKIWRPLLSIVATTLVSITGVGLFFTYGSIQEAIKTQSTTPLMFGRCRSRELCDEISTQTQKFQALSVK